MYNVPQVYPWGGASLSSPSNNFFKHFLKNTALGRLVLFILYSIIGFITSLLGRLLGLHRYDNIFIICERWHEARDNGYALFKYIRTTYPTYPVFYVFDTRQKNIDSHKIHALGNILPHRSIKTLIYLYFARYIASPHIDIAFMIKRYFGDHVWNQKISCFLQHGVTKDRLGKYYQQIGSTFDIIISGALPEFEFLKEESKNLHITPIYTGFARWDRLHNLPTPKRSILIMPTWRQYLVYPSCGAKDDLSERISFLKSTDYYIYWQNLLDSPEVHNILASNDIQIVFYAHPNLYNSLGSPIFSSSSPSIHIADPSKDDLLSIIEESAMLITDFSSIFWEFSYMKRPIIYYQFDKNSFREKHYQQGYFSYSRDGFGPVLTDHSALVQKIQDYIQKDFTPEPSFLQKSALHFNLWDDKNSHRNFITITSFSKRNSS
ncbi:MAG: CDP-glycerol glycerophosphotransferase family protein [Brevinema sp.]